MGKGVFITKTFRAVKQIGEISADVLMMAKAANGIFEEERKCIVMSFNKWLNRCNEQIKKMQSAIRMTQDIHRFESIFTSVKKILTNFQKLQKKFYILCAQRIKKLRYTTEIKHILKTCSL
ncbi:MAG TPA: hypothetical protein VK787_15745 [Puia sp.]|nr:hypothetical protein [Puia sp.]